MDLSIHEDDTSEDDEEDPPASEELFFDDNEVDAYDRLCNSDQNVVKPLTSNQKHLLGLLANCTIESYDNPIMVCKHDFFFIPNNIYLFRPIAKS